MKLHNEHSSMIPRIEMGILCLCTCKIACAGAKNDPCTVLQSTKDGSLQAAHQMSLVMKNSAYTELPNRGHQLPADWPEYYYDCLGMGAVEGEDASSCNGFNRMQCRRKENRARHGARVVAPTTPLEAY